MSQDKWEAEFHQSVRLLALSLRTLRCQKVAFQLKLQVVVSLGRDLRRSQNENVPVTFHEYEMQCSMPLLGGCNRWVG